MKLISNLRNKKTFNMNLIDKKSMKKMTSIENELNEKKKRFKKFN